MNLVICPIVVGPKMTKNALLSMLDQDIETRVLAIANGAEYGCAQMLRALAMQHLRLHVVEYATRRPLNKVWNEYIDRAFTRMALDYVLVVNNDTELNQHTYRILRDSNLPFVTAVGQREPVRETAEFMDGEAHVKISHFTQQGLRVTGVVHVGANDGYEIQWYRKMGARVIAFEPLEKAFSLAWDKYSSDPDVELRCLALGDHDEIAQLNVTTGDGQGSSFLRELGGPYTFEDRQTAAVTRFDSLGLDLAGFNTLVVDTQGMELHVLRGFGEELRKFDFLNIECSRVPLYESGHSAQEVIDYLATFDFVQDTPIEDHNDIMFIRRGLKLIDKKRPHPDFSCYLIRKECWDRVGRFDEEINAFYGDNDYHLRMHRAGVEAWSLPIPFLHIASGTLKQASNELRDAIQREADSDRQVFERKYGFLPATREYEEAFR